jgi:iron complex transport system substrate-binding protein
LIGINKKEMIKMKTSILLGITMLLLALPATASDYTLGIFGNANEDDTINMQDVTYTELIILEYRDATELADAKYDGEIDILDMTQIALIILGRENEITILDSAERSVTVKMPVERFIPLFHRTPEVMLALGAKDKIVAIDSLFHNAMPEFGLEELPEVSRHGRNVDYEKILALETDLVVLPVVSSEQADEIAEKLPTVAVIVIDCMDRRTVVPDLKTMGVVLGKQNEADALIDWVQKYEEMVEERTKDLTPEEMPKFLLVCFMSKESGIRAATLHNNLGLVAEKCGGRNIAAELSGSFPVVDSEWVMTQNPDVLFIAPMGSGYTGVGKTDADLEEFLTQTIADFPELENVNAVKNNKVCVIDFNLHCGPRWILANCYFAKWLHPGLFEDIDPEEMHKKEYLDEFHGLELEGTWAYPAPE